MSDQVTLKDVLNIVQQSSEQYVRLVGDVRDDVRGLRDDFNTMEKGRLTNAEVKINDLTTKLELMEAREKERSDNTMQWRNWLVPAVLYVAGQAALIVILRHWIEPK